MRSVPPRRHVFWTTLIFAVAQGERGSGSICILRLGYSHYKEIAASHSYQRHLASLDEHRDPMSFGERYRGEFDEANAEFTKIVWILRFVEEKWPKGNRYDRTRCLSKFSLKEHVEHEIRTDIGDSFLITHVPIYVGS